MSILATLLIKIMITAGMMSGIVVILAALIVLPGRLHERRGMATFGETATQNRVIPVTLVTDA
jgi:hypothetical protein